MADTKLTALTELTSAADTDIVYVVDDPAGSPVSKKITKANLLKVGTDIQAYDAGLASIAGLTTAADKMIYTSALDTYAVADLTAAGRALLDDANAAAQRVTLGVEIGVDVQAYDATILKQADVDDTPVNGVTTAPVSSNWAYDHENAAAAHGVSGAVVGTTDAQALTNKTIDCDSNTVSNVGLAEFDTDTSDIFNVFNAIALDSPVATVTSDGATITLSLEKNGGGDVRLVFSDGIYTLDCTPADTVTLTAGSDTSPQINYVYVLQSNKTLTASTTGFPATEHAPVATVYCQSAASLQTDGAYKVHAWTDHAASSNSQGHLAHLNFWIRHQNATWRSGAACTPTGGAATFDIATTSGNILQLHDHAFPAFNTATGSDIYVVNDSATAFNKLGDLTTATTDASGVSMAGRWYSLVIWGVVNEASADCKLMVNLPTGSYNNNNGSKATLDLEALAVYDIPADFVGTGFLIAKVTASESGGTFTIQETVDLRGKFPSTAAGGGAVGGNEFTDNVFRIQDDGDATKQIAFQASGITTATTRTFTAPDADGTLLLDGDIGSSVQAYDATILTQSDVDDTPVNGVTTAPISSNWAYDHNALANPHGTDLNDLGSVTITGVAKGDILVYDSVAGQWVDLTVGSNDQVLTADSAQDAGVKWATSPAGVTTFSALTDTNITGPVNNDLLQWDGTDWVDRTLAEAGVEAAGTTATHAALTATHGVSGDIVGTSDSQTLTNKTITTPSLTLETGTTPTAEGAIQWHSTNDTILVGDGVGTKTFSDDDAVKAFITYEQLNTNGDVGTGSAQVAAGDHNHSGTYEPADATIIKQADVDDTPVNGATTDPISSNWAFDHVAAADPHTVYPLDTEVRKIGKETAYIPATAMISATTNGAAFTEVETGTNDYMVSSMDFDASTDEYAQFTVRFPKSWNEGTITFQPYWSATTANTDGVSWGLQATALADSGAIGGAAWGTGVVVDDANQSTANDILIGAESGAVTIAGTPAAGEMCWFRVYRDVSDANDTLATDAKLVGIAIFYTTDAADDT